MDNVIFHVNGGIGKNVAATAVAQAIKDNFPEHRLVVVTGWPEIWKTNPDCDKVYRFGSTQYFYEDYIKSGKAVLLAQEPYLSTQHVLERKPLRQSWIEMYGLEYKEEYYPKLHFNFQHLEKARTFKRDKPILVIHGNGGAVPPPEQENPNTYSWCRDLPKRILQKLVDELKTKYHIMQVCYHQDQVIEGCEVLQNLNEMEAFAFLKATDKRLFIDSCMQHGAGAMNMESTVCWIGNNPKVWSYPCHKHILPSAEIKFNAPSHDLYQQYDIASASDQYPYDTDFIFNVDEIIGSLETQYYESDLFNME